MPPSPQVNCHPYFRLRRLTPHFQLGPQAPAPWSTPNLCAAYNWPTGLAGGGVIAIVELGGGWVQSDIDQYFKSINQPVPNITDVSVDGTKNSPNQSTGSNSDPDYEVALDIEVSAAAYYAATGKPATIRMYWSQDIATAVEKAANDGCDVCSISWGADESTWGTEAADEMESAAATATALGMIVFAASGDNDSSDGSSTPANVDAPSSCPHVVGCGGTYKTSTVETVWNDNPGQTNGEGTGGGYILGRKVESLGSLRCIAVSTSPGATALKRIPSLAYSVARFCVAEFSPPFVIIEIEPFTPAIGRSASAAVMLTMHPDFCFSISFTVR